MGILATIVLAVSVLLTEGFDSKPDGWSLNGSSVERQGTNRFVRMQKTSNRPCWVTTPVVKGMSSGRTYTIKAKVRGHGVLWLHAWNNARNGGGLPVGALDCGREIDITKRVDCDDWKVIGLRGGSVWSTAEQVRICFEVRGSGWLDVDDISVCADEPLEPREGFRCAFDRREIVLGETAVARISDDKPIGTDVYEFAFVTHFNSVSRVFDEVADGKRGVFRARPAFPGTFRLRVTRNDEFGLTDVREISLTVLPAPRPPKVAPTLDATAEFRIGGQKGGASLSTGLRPRLGYPEYLRVRVTNDSTNRQEVVIRAADEKPETDPAFVESVWAAVEPNDATEFVLPIQTFLNVPHVLQIELENTDGVCAPLALALDPIETYPLFGTQEQFDRNPPGRARALKDMRFLRELPCQLFRIPDVMRWEKEDDFDDADFVVDGLQRVGCTQLHPFLGYVPDELKPLDVDFLPAKSARWRCCVEKFVGRYAGRIRYWEAFNEPPWNGFDDYRKNGGHVLVELQRHLWEVVKAKDPSAKLVAPGWCRELDFPVIEDYLAQGGDRYTDVYNMHEYTVWDRDWTGETEEDAALAFARGSAEAVSKGQVFRMLGILRKNAITKPLFVTECGGNLSPTTPLKCRMKAILALEAHFAWLAAGVAGIQQYELCDYDHEALPSQFGLVRARLGEKLPFYWAYREEILALTGAKPTGPIAVDGDLRRVDFTRGNERIRLIWNIGKGTRAISCSAAEDVYATRIVLMNPFSAEFITRRAVRGGLRDDLTLPKLSILMLVEKSIR